MTYRETVQFLYAQLPMFQRQGGPALKKDLSNTLALCQALEHPEQKFRAIHIAGTNGKGSVSHLIASVLQSAGYKTGLYTSPHLYDFRERVKINGQPIGKQIVVDFVERLLPVIERIQPSFFELTVALAFDCFARAEVDFAVVETGLGGRLDSTNVLSPLLSIITNIGLDHQQFLGNTLPEIAAEKAGIIKAEVPVLIGADQPELLAVFQNKAATENASLFKAQDICQLEVLQHSWNQLSFNVKMTSTPSYDGLDCPLSSGYQLENIRTALAGLSLLPISLDALAVRDGLAAVKTQTGFYARWDILQEEAPKIVVDGGHNLPGLQALFEQVENVAHDHLHIVLGMVKDKELDKLLPLFPIAATYYFATPDVPRGLDAATLQAVAHAQERYGQSYQSVSAALNDAIENAGANDLVLVCGSLYVAAEVDRTRFA